MTQDSYLDHASNLRPRFPCLDQFFEDWERFAPQKLPPTSAPRRLISPGRVGVLEFVPGKQPEFVDLSNPEKLREYLDGVHPGAACQNRLFLLEDLDETNLEILGAALLIDPVVLADHLFTYHFSQNHTVPHRTLPSLTHPARSFTLRYYELRETDDRQAESQTLNRRRTFARVSREIDRWQDLPSRWKGQGDTYVDLVRHNVSFWCDESESPGSKTHKRPYPWNGQSPSLWRVSPAPNAPAAILLVDPPIASQQAVGRGYYYVLDRERDREAWRAQIQWSRAYRVGYSDLRPWQSSHASTAPSRRSMFDDVVFYWQQADRREIELVFDHCVNATLFVHQIVASHWLEFLDLQLKTLSTIDLTSRRKRGASVRRVLTTEEWKDELEYYNERLSLLGIFQRRLMWYEQEMLLNLERLGVAPGVTGGEDPVSTSLRAARRDFQAIFCQLELHKSRADNLVGIVADSINLSSALRNLHEARFGLRLSLVGAIFFPVTLVATLFSMGGDYQPGAKDFWIPWVVAVPLVIILVFMIWQSRRPRLLGS